MEAIAPVTPKRVPAVFMRPSLQARPAAANRPLPPAVPGPGSIGRRGRLRVGWAEQGLAQSPQIGAAPVNRTNALMGGKRGLVMGVANDRSLAWGIAKALSEAGAELAFTYQGEALGRRVRALARSLR